MIYPICFETGPLAISGIADEFSLKPTEGIPVKSMSDDEFSKMIDLLESAHQSTDENHSTDQNDAVVEDEEMEGLRPEFFEPVELTPEQIERKKRRERYEEFLNMGMVTEDDKVEIGALFPPQGSIIQFPGHNPRPDQENFPGLTKNFENLGNMLEHDAAQR